MKNSRCEAPSWFPGFCVNLVMIFTKAGNDYFARFAGLFRELVDQSNVREYPLLLYF